MKWIKASERLPKFEELLVVRIDERLTKLGNFYEDEKKEWFFHVSSQGDVPGWEIPANMFGGIEWLDEQADEWVSVDFLPVLQGNLQAQTAGYFNYDKSDMDRKIRNAVICEYKDLIAIYKSKYQPPKQ